MSYLNPNDPATLWYPKDFLSEIQILDDNEIGILMRFRATFFFHGRLSEEHLKRSIGTLPDSLKGLILQDGNGKYYCPNTEKIIKDRRDHSIKKSKDGKKGNEVKKLMSAKGISKEEARAQLTEEKGYKFGKDQHYTPSDTPSVHNKGNAIGNRNDNTITKEEEKEVNRVIEKQGGGFPLSNDEKALLYKHNLHLLS